MLPLATRCAWTMTTTPSPLKDHVGRVPTRPLATMPPKPSSEQAATSVEEMAREAHSGCLHYLLVKALEDARKRQNRLRPQQPSIAARKAPIDWLEDCCYNPLSYSRIRTTLTSRTGGSREVGSRRNSVHQSIIYAFSVSLLGYALLALTALALTLLVGLATGYRSSLTFFTLALLTFRLSEIHWAFVLFPPLAAACGTILLSKTPLHRTLAAGLGLSSPYVLIALVYVLMRAGEFPLEIVIPWVLWIFVVGVVSSVAVDRFRFAE